MAVFLRTPYNYDVRAASRESGVDCSESEDFTKQEFRDEVDINTILRRFNVTGQLPQGVRMPTYGDFTQVGDFQQALAAIETARESFMQLPADVRRRFDNDPGAFVDFASDARNLEEARKLGLVPAAELVAAAPASASPGQGASPSPGAVPAASAASSTLPT